MRTTSAEQAAAADLRRAVTSLAARARVERGGELTLNQVAVLGRVAVRAPITPGEVAGELGMLPQSLTRVLAGLESSGLIRRTPDPEDGRGSLLGITQAGLRALDAEMGPRDRWMVQAMSAVCSDEDRAVLGAAAAIMQRLVDHDGGVAPAEP